MNINSQLDELEQYLKYMEDYLSTKKGEAKSPQQPNDPAEYFQNLLHSSVFVTIYSTVEAELNRICREQQKSRKIKLPLGELKGSGIIRAYNYLNWVCGVKTPSGANWKEIKHYNTLRNVIVHKDGEENHHLLGKYISLHPHLEQREMEVILGKAFCLEAITTARSFFAELNQTLTKK